VNDLAPVVSAGAAASINEGGTFTGSGSFTDPGADTWTATVDYGDGSGPQALTLNSDKTFSLNHLYGVSGSYQVTVAVKDDDGSVGTSTWNVTVNNLPPVVTISPNPTITQGQTFTDSGSFTDPGTETWTATVNYGDGSGTQALTLNPDKTFNLGHVYNVAGNFTVTVVVTDQEGASGSVAEGVTVLPVNVPPTVTVAGPTLGVRGQPLTLTFTASTLAGDPAAPFTYVVQWGDQSPAQTVAGTAGVSLDHVFTHSGTFTIHATATAANGLSGQATYQVVVRGVSLEADPLNAGKAMLVVGGTLGNGQILFEPGHKHGELKVYLNGHDLGTFAPTSRIVAYAQAGNDFIRVSPPVKLPAWLYGGSGNDVLIGGGTNVLVGGTGNDVVVGGGGRSLLIGGGGKDVLVAGKGGDLLIGGSTAFDQREAALNAILAEWTSSRSLTQRIHNLEGRGTGPRLNGNVFLTTTGPSATVHLNPSDWLFGNLRRDWLIPGKHG
jgi:hypothetical protein